MATKSYTYMGLLSIIECANCHMDFGVTPRFQEERRNDHERFKCPAGHANYYPQESDEERLRKERDAARAKLTSTSDQLQAAQNEAEATRRTLVRERARFANGVCPCCNRSFSDVKRHMDTKHPDYDASHLLPGEALFRCTCGYRAKSYRGLRTHQGHSSWGRHETKV